MSSKVSEQIEIDGEVLSKAKKVANRTGRSLGEYIEELIVEDELIAI